MYLNVVSSSVNVFLHDNLLIVMALIDWEMINLKLRIWLAQTVPVILQFYAEYNN